MKNVSVLFFVLISVMLVGCGPGFQALHYDLPPIETPDPTDDSVVIGRAIVHISNGQIVAFNRKKPFNIVDLIMPRAFAYNGSTPPSATVSITYTNAASSNFALTPGAVSSSPTLSVDGLTLDFGSVSLGSLDDNALKKCGAVGTQAGTGTQKCNRAVVRVYATGGDADGVFCNTAEVYCVPMKVNGNSFGVGVANAQEVLTHTIPTNVNRLRKSQLATTTWPLAVDMTNAGEGSYSATVVIEYVLKRL